MIARNLVQARAATASRRRKRSVSAAAPSALPLDLLHQRADVLVLQAAVEETPIEVAVVADRRAEGNVDVETERHVTLNSACRIQK